MLFERLKELYRGIGKKHIWFYLIALVLCITIIFKFFKEETSPDIYLHKSDFPFFQNFPFELSLGMDIKEFNVKYSGYTKELLSPFPNLKLFKGNEMRFGKNGWLQDYNTFFLFKEKKLEVVILGLVINPEYEESLYKTFDNEYPFHFRTENLPFSFYIWQKSRPRFYSETLFLEHGASSGTNYLTLVRNNFLIEDFLTDFNIIKLQNKSFEESFSEYKNLINILYSIISREEYSEYIYKRFEISTGSLSSSINKYEKIINQISFIEELNDGSK